MAKAAEQGKGGASGSEPLALPSEFEKFSCHPLMRAGVKNISLARYNRRGMRNDANNCYVNVVVQSLLPCSVLMQLLSHCARTDLERPFYTGMVRLCKEFYSRKPRSETFNILLLPQVMDIMSTWQSIGAQQDAGEFLLYMLNGMHEECKWKDSAHHLGGEEENGVAQEDSPVVRIFGGVIQSSLRSNGAKVDSLSMEPFNHLILDISSASVDSVCSALEAFCRQEAVDEGRATKRLQFKSLPKVLILTLKRFSYNKDTGCPQKIKKSIAYEETLKFDDSWLVDGVKSQDYHLSAVICHHGESANGGHYNAAVRYNSDWYMYDDVLIRQMELREVVNQMFTSYLLIYQCRDKVRLNPQPC